MNMNMNVNVNVNVNIEKATDTLIDTLIAWS